MARRRGVTRERVLPEPLLQLFLHSLLLVSQHFIMLSAPRSCILMSDPHFRWIHTLALSHTHTGGNFEVLLQHTEVEDGGEKLQPFTVFWWNLPREAAERREAGQTRIPAKCRKKKTPKSPPLRTLTEVHISYISACTSRTAGFGEQNPLNNCGSVRRGSEQETVTRVHLWRNRRCDSVVQTDTEAQMFLILEEIFPSSRLFFLFDCRQKQTS